MTFPTQCPESLPHPVLDYLAGLKLEPPSAPHSPSFFNPPSSSDPSSRLGPAIDQATSYVHFVLPPWVENHCYRVYAAGLAIADFAGWSKPGAESTRLGWDKELWFLTALLHDIGWDPRERRQTRLSYELYGGIRARELLMDWGTPQEVADEVCEAIARHTSGEFTGSIRLMGALAQIGPSHDFRGIAVPLYMHQKDNDIIWERWPRLDLIHQFRDTITDEVACKPGCMSTMWAPRVFKALDVIERSQVSQGKERENEKRKVRRNGVKL